MIYINADPAIWVERYHIMSRKPNPDRVDVASMVTRTITFAEYEVSYLPKGEKTVTTVKESALSNDQIARRDLRRKYRELGIITGIELISTHTEPYYMTIEDFVKNGKPLPKTETKIESESTEVVNNG